MIIEKPVRSTRISSDVDFKRPGAQHTHLRIPHSTPESAYGVIQVPIVVLGNGDGPTVLLMAGNHGDEYEGQVALFKFIRSVRPEQISGRIIVLPSANYPAAEAGCRISPVDNGNLNRCFPGELNGSPTQMIAHYIENYVLPECNFSIDLHSGGKSLLYAPCILARYYQSEESRGIISGLIDAFGAPYAALFRPVQGETRTMSAAAERAGIPHLNMELGGAGMIDVSVLKMTEIGIRNMLAHLGVLPDWQVQAPKRMTQLLMLKGSSSYLYSEERGYFEPYTDIGGAVEPGQLVGAIHHLEAPWRTPTELRAAINGVVLCRRVQGVTAPGDCLVQIAAEFDESAFR